MPDYDMLAVGSGFAGSAATLAEAGKNGAWPGASRWMKPFPRLNHSLATSLSRSSAFGRVIGANVAESLPETDGRIERRFE